MFFNHSTNVLLTNYSFGKSVRTSTLCMTQVMFPEAKETHTYLDEVLASGVEHLNKLRRAAHSRSSDAKIFMYNVSTDKLSSSGY